MVRTGPQPIKIEMLIENVPHRAGVYRIINTVTGECYVGGTQDMAGRCRGHALSLMNGTHFCKKLMASYRIHGGAAFSAVVVEECEMDDLAIVELRWLKTILPAFNNTHRTGRTRRYGSTVSFAGPIIIRDPSLVEILAEEMAFGAGKTLGAAAEKLLRRVCVKRKSRRERLVHSVTS